MKKIGKLLCNSDLRFHCREGKSTETFSSGIKRVKFKTCATYLGVKENA